jgi:hypothetical protein
MPARPRRNNRRDADRRWFEATATPAAIERQRASQES